MIKTSLLQLENKQEIACEIVDTSQEAHRLWWELRVMVRVCPGSSLLRAFFKDSVFSSEEVSTLPAYVLV